MANRGRPKGSKTKTSEEKIYFSFCIDEKEINFVRNLLNRYLSQRSFENEAEKDLLKQLLYTSLLIDRLQIILNTAYQKSNPEMNVHMIERMQELTNQSISFKKQLGLIAEETEQANWVEYQKALDKKALQYFSEHAGETYTRCPECKKIIRLLMKVDNLTPAQATFFRGTTLFNRDLYQMYHDKRITLEEMAKIFGVSNREITYLYENLFLKEIENDRKN